MPENLRSVLIATMRLLGAGFKISDLVRYIKINNKDLCLGTEESLLSIYCLEIISDKRYRDWFSKQGEYYFLNKKGLDFLPYPKFW